MKASYVQNSSVCPELASGPSVHLRIHEVRVHSGLRIEKPGSDEVDGIVGVGGGVIGEDPGDDVVDNSIRELRKVADVVDETAVGVEEAVAFVVGTDGPD